MTFYIERDRFACAWLMGPMAEGLIPEGGVEGSHGCFKLE